MGKFVILATTALFLFAGLQLPQFWNGAGPDGGLNTDLVASGDVQSVVAMSADERAQRMRKEMDVLRVSPLDVTAHRNLAILALAPPVSEESKQLILNLAKFSLTDAPVQIAALEIFLSEQKYKDAAFHLDAVLRARPKMSEQLFPLVAQQFEQAQALPMLVETLAQNPPWRGAFLAFAAAQPAHTNLSVELVRGLKNTSAPTTGAELRQMIASWVKVTGTYDMAYFVWLDQLTAEELRLVKGVYDGEFTLDPKNVYFDWVIGSSRNGKSRIVTKPGSGTDRALQVEFVGNKEPFKHVGQFLQLSPGRYQMSFEVMSKNIVAEAGLVWRMNCVAPGPALGESAAVKSPTPWMPVSMAFEVPNKDCSTQNLRLETKARQGLDTGIDGLVYFDSIVIKSVASEGAP